MLFAALGVGVFAAYVQLSPAARRVPDELRRVEKPAPVVHQSDHVSTPSRHRGPSVEIQKEPTLFVAALDGENVKLVPLKGDPKGQKPEVFAANHAFQNLKLGAARALAVEVKERVAYLDCNPALNEGFGSMEEANVIKALQMTLGQFKEIDSFQIRIEGEIVDSLGHFEMTEPVPVIRPGKTEPDQASSTKPSEDPASAAPR